MKATITSIGTALPLFTESQVKTAEKLNASLELTAAEKRMLRHVFLSSGIEKRHSVISDFCKEMADFSFFPNSSDQPFPSTAKRMQLYKETALPLALEAVTNCFQAIGDFNLTDITHVITISCTGMYAPGLDIELVQQLKLKPQTKRTCINFMGCYGAFNGIKMANAICSESPDAKVLLVSVELCTLHIQKLVSLDNIVANAIFADGAAALLIEAKPSKQHGLRLDLFHCDLLPQHAKDMAWHIGDNGFDIVLSSYVPNAIQSGIAEFTQRLLTQTNLDLSEIDYFAIHPGGKKILEACEKALHITKHDNRYSYDILRNCGNMSSATILFVLKAIWDDLPKENSEQSIFCCAFGPGLTLESMLLSTV